ncbi:MAG: hypothetical protein J6D29_03040 [Solobacterium sp.]|nr:hypothetical protein [Solobacterium sp.]
MKITSFNPIYGTQNIEEALRFFEGLGFTVQHSFDKEGFSLRSLENSEGLRVEVMDSDYVRENNIEGYFSTRLNVDNLDEAIAYFEKEGAKAITPVFKEAETREVINYLTKNGDLYCLVHHLK